MKLAIGILIITLGAALTIGAAWSRESDAALLRARVTHLEAELTVVKASVPDEKPSIAMLERDMSLCRQRTENLRAVLEVLIPSGIWPERVRLPDPPPGWIAWPKPGPDRTP